jgi:hypothetical protein
MFTRNGVPTAGGMGDMEDMPANNTWEIYLATDDIVKTVEAAETSGAQPLAPAMSLADLGLQTTLIDPTAPTMASGNQGPFPGFTVLDEHGAPSWFELHTRPRGRCCLLSHRLPLGHEDCGRQRPVLLHDYAGS